jgi:putative ABC transport system substrate-binding protein
MGFLAAVALAATAQQPPADVRVGFLIASSTTGQSQKNVEAFRQGLRDLGYVEGRNIAIEYRYADGRYDRLPALAAELVGLGLRAIVASTGAAAHAAKAATSSIPIVFAVGGDPVASGLVVSLARPGGNLTGMATLDLELSGKRLDLLRELVPSASRAAILWNPANPSHRDFVQGAEAPARALGFTIRTVEYRVAEDFPRAVETARAAQSDAVLVLNDTVSIQNGKRIAELAAANRLPAVFGFPEAASVGGLIGYGPAVASYFRRAAWYLDQILKGAKPADLPVEQPTKFDLVVNLKTAKELGINIPQSILLRADEVIE